MERQLEFGSSKNLRDLSYDVLKGILILLVVLGHSIQDPFGNVCWNNVLFNFIYTFHMPLFIMVSGYFSHSMINRSFGTVLKSKWKRIGIPWLIWSTVLVIIYYTSVSYSNDPLSGIGANVKEIYRMYTEIWYLVCVLVLSIIYYPILYWIKRTEGIKLYILPCVFVILWILSIVFFDETPNWLLKRCQIVRQTLAFGLGMLYYFKIQHQKGWRWTFTIMSILIIIGDRLLFGLWIAEYTLFERIIDGVACGILAFAILKPLSSFIKDSYVGKLLVYFGEYSLAIYVIHMTIRYFVLDNCYLQQASPLIYYAIYLSASLVIMVIIKRIFKSNSYLFGV